MVDAARPRSCRRRRRRWPRRSTSSRSPNLPLPGPRRVRPRRPTCPACNSTTGSTRDAIGQRPAAEHGQHHARRHEHPGQLREVVGRHVHARQPAPRRGRGSDDFDGGRRAPTWRARAACRCRFVTRSGTNQFQGSAYYYCRRDWMNTNTWFNLHRNVDADRQADRQAGAAPVPAGRPHRRPDPSRTRRSSSSTTSGSARPGTTRLHARRS